MRLHKRYLSVLAITLLGFNGCTKTVHVKTPCALVPPYEMNLTIMEMDYEIYEVYDENGTFIREEIKGISKESFAELMSNYDEAKSCCLVMNINAEDINGVNAKSKGK